MNRKLDVGKKLKLNDAEQGHVVVSRLDGQSFSAEMNTYRRNEIYSVLKIAIETQTGLPLQTKSIVSDSSDSD